MSSSWEFELPVNGPPDSHAESGQPPPSASYARNEPLPGAEATSPAGAAWAALNGRERAAAFLEVGRATEALTLLQTWMDRHPEDVTGWCLVSQGLFFVREEHQALRAADLAIEADPYDTQGYAWKCRLTLCRGWTQDTLETVATGLEMTYQDPALRPWQIRALVARGRRAEALQLLNATSPAHLDAEWALARGECALDVGDLPAADEAFQWAYRLNPKSVSAMLGMAAVFLARGQDPQAVNCLHQALLLAAGGPEPARCAVEMLDAIVERDAPSLRPGALAVGLVVPQLSVFMLAGEHFRQQAAQKRVHGLLTPELFRYYHWHKAQDQASSVSLFGLFCRYLLAPGLALVFLSAVTWSYGWEAGVRLGILIAIGKAVVGLVVERYRKVPVAPFVFRFPDSVAPRSRSLEEKEEGEDAEEAEPEHADVLRRRCWYFLDHGEPAKAKEAALERVSLNPANHDAQVYLSITALLTGNVKEALMAARRARSFSPGDARGHALLWAGLAAKGALEAAVKEAERASEFHEDAERLLKWLMPQMHRHASPESARSVSTLIERIYPYSGAPHQVEGDRLINERAWEAAEAAYRRGLAVEPDSADLHSGLSWSLAARHRYLASLQEARQALNLAPNQVFARNSLVRHTQLLLHLAPVVLGLVAALIATLPTLAGARTNYWMVGVSAGVPALGGLLLGLLVRPIVRRLAPGLLRDALPCETFREGLRHYGLLGWTLASAACLSVQVLQCWLELLLHRDLLGIRWPGAVTVLVAAAYAGWLAWMRLSPFRWRHWWKPLL